MTSSRRQLLQPSKMVNPFLISPSPHLRKGELVNDVAVVIAEILSKQTLHILKNERLRSDLADCAHSLWKHISLVVLSQVLASQGKRLAGWASGDELHSSRVLREVVVANIPFNDSPRRHMSHSSIVIPAKGVASVAVPFQHDLMVETSLSNTESQSASTRKKFNRFHIRPTLFTAPTTTHRG